MKSVFLLAFGLAALTSGAAHAQDAAKVGLTMGYPSSVGVIWQVADRVAVRPEITLSRATGESSGNDLLGAAPISTDESTGVGVGLAGLFYLRQFDGLRTYVSPRLTYTRTSTSASATSTPPLSAPSTSDATVSSYAAAGSFGAQYAFARHFALFGELGVQYTRTNTSQTSTLTTTVFGVVNGVPTQTARTQTLQSSARSNTVATRSAVGVIFYF